MSDAKQVMDALPSLFQTPWAQLREQTVENEELLTICLAGAFSVGKSSLVNMLVGEPLLTTALPETTAMPTFLDFGPTRVFGRGNKQEWSELSFEEFQHLSTAGTGGDGDIDPDEYLSVTLAQPWLKGLQLVDLPGLGGSDKARRAFARSQIAAADVVLYLLDPRGATSADLAEIRFAIERGKSLKILVGRWDIVEKSVTERGEPRPDLIEWAEQIQQNTGFETELLPVSTDGTGRTELLKFFESIRDRADEIRQERFAAEAAPLLSRACNHIEQEMAVAQAATDDEIKRVRRQIYQQKSDLMTLRDEVVEQREVERKTFEESFESSRNQYAKTLKIALEEAQKELLAADPSSKQWEVFVAQVNSAGERALTAFVDDARSLHKAAVDVHALQANWQSLAIQFPMVHTPDERILFSAAQAQRLEEQCALLAAELAAGEGMNLEQVDEASRQQLLAHLKEFQAERNKVAMQEIPTIQRVSTSGLGRQIGRFTGEAADIALMFVQPQLVATKVASLLGKGATAVKIGDLAGKAVKGARVATGVAVAGGKGLASGARRLAGRLGFLEMLSVGYLGEKLGSFVDDLFTEVSWEIDHEAEQQRHQSLLEFDTHIGHLREEIAALNAQEDAVHASEFEIKQKKRKMARLENQLKKARDEEAEARKRFEREARQAQLERVKNASDMAVERGIERFSQQARGIRLLTQNAFKAFWETELKKALDEHNKALESMEKTLDKTPELRAKKLDQLKKRLGTLRHYSATI